MAITVGSFQLTPTVSTQTQINSNLEFDEAIIYFGTSATDNTNAVEVYVNGESDPIPFSPGDKFILNGAGGEELNFNQYDIKTSNSEDGISVIWQRHQPYGS